MVDEKVRAIAEWLEEAKEEFNEEYEDFDFEDKADKEGIIRCLVVAYIQIRFLVTDKIAKKCLDAWLYREAG